MVTGLVFMIDMAKGTLSGVMVRDVTFLFRSIFCVTQGLEVTQSAF